MNSHIVATIIISERRMAVVAVLVFVRRRLQSDRSQEQNPRKAVQSLLVQECSQDRSVSKKIPGLHRPRTLTKDQLQYWPSGVVMKRFHGYLYKVASYRTWYIGSCRYNSLFSEILSSRYNNANKTYSKTKYRQGRTELGIARHGTKTLSAS